MAGGLRILLVEDNVDNRELLERLLRINGHDVRGVEGERAAIDAAAGEQFDLLISDIGLPDGDGCHLLLELRRTHANVRGIAVTGRSEEEFSARCRAAGFCAFVRKPVSFAQLLAAVDSAGPTRP